VTERMSLSATVRDRLRAVLRRVVVVQRFVREENEVPRGRRVVANGRGTETRLVKKQHFHGDSFVVMLLSGICNVALGGPRLMCQSSKCSSNNKY